MQESSTIAVGECTKTVAQYNLGLDLNLDIEIAFAGTGLLINLKLLWCSTMLFGEINLCKKSRRVQAWDAINE